MTNLTIPELSVIIVSYNTRQMTLDCLRTLFAKLAGLSAEVIVVDNASSDGSVSAIRAQFPQVRVIENTLNCGFGAANNRAMAEAQGRFLLLLNSDAFPLPGALQVLTDYLRSHERVGAVGPRLLNVDGSLQRSCFRFPSPGRAWVENLWFSALLPNHPVVGDYRRWPHDTERDVDSVIGACMLIRHEVYRQIGGFDEQFFMYSEETDWQRRMRDHGWHIAFTPHAEVTHLGGASGAAEAPRVRKHFFDSLDYYERKHHGLAGLISLRLAMMVGCLLRALLWTLVMALVPSRRTAARSKAGLLTWLFFRQSLHWRTALKSHTAL